ncbi:MAG: two-component response regulator [Candidatus Saccharibacteria bacterium]|nr:two-component response regulator [Candidatus Saccharibacteria bacterium]
MSKPTKKILIIDDEASIREAVRLTVEEQDFLNIEVTESADVASGIQQMKAIDPDIIILDLHMPDKTGFDFMDIVQKNKLLGKAKVIMLTADDTLGNLFKAEHKGIGAYHFLGKPFNISELQALVLDLSLLD